jgi:hypothetical protein
MVCYARPAGCFAAIVAVAWLVFAGPVSHLFGHAAALVAILAAVVGTAVAAALAFAIFMATRRHRAATGGCVSCRFQCQHAMTEQTSGPVPQLRERGMEIIRSSPVLLPMPAVRVAATSAPRWPDQPIHRTHREKAAAACAVSS